MTYNTEKYDGKRLIILRAALIAIGAVIGGVCVWQYFVAYPDIMRKEFRIVIIVVSAAVIAAILGLSAKPMYRLIASVIAVFGRISGSLGGKGIAAATAGFVAAGIVGYLFDMSVRYAISVIAVRVLADVLVSLLCVLALCYAFMRWLGAEAEDRTAVESVPFSGYLFTASCFSDDRVFVAADVLNNVKVSDSVFKALCVLGSDAAAADRLKVLLESGRIERIRNSAKFDTASQYAESEARLAISKRLRPVYFGGESVADGAVRLETFAACARNAEAPVQADGNAAASDA